MAENSGRNSHKADHLREHCFRPGQSGNPGGRPKGTLRDLLNERLDEIDPRTQKTYGRLLAEALVRAALGGNVEAFKAIADRIEGKPRLSVELTKDGTLPVMTLEECHARIIEIVEAGRRRAAEANATKEPPVKPNGDRPN